MVVGTTDVHGRLRAWDYYANQAEAVRGLSRAATIVDSVRAANPGRVILLDAGDLLQGNPLAYVAARVAGDRTNPIVAAMNAMQYDRGYWKSMSTTRSAVFATAVDRPGFLFFSKHIGSITAGVTHQAWDTRAGG